MDFKMYLNDEKGTKATYWRSRHFQDGSNWLQKLIILLELSYTCDIRKVKIIICLIPHDSWFMNFCNKSVSSFTIVTATCPNNTPISRKIIYLSDKIWQNEMGPLIAYEFSRISYDMIHIDGGVILRGSVEMMEATMQS